MNSNGPLRTACGLKMIEEALKPTVEATKKVIMLAQSQGLIKGDEKLTLPQLCKIAEAIV